MRLNEMLEDFLFARTKDFAPDGRPLYAYKCRNEEYQHFEMLMHEIMPKVLNGYFEPSFGPLFCIYAAESWRRKHEGGRWKWETVFADILDSDPRHATIVDWVTHGLAYWKRPILKNRIGHNEYLVTIACEGGLPLLLLRKENAHLKHYFKNLLESYHRERHRPACNAAEIAQRLSVILPKSLRHDIVFNLGGDLVKKIVDLQEEVADAVNPIRALDQSNKNWRDTLPLPLEDGTVELLLKNLVQEARSLSVTEQQRVRWRGIIRIQEPIAIEKRLDLPKVFSGQFLQRWSNRTDLPPRMNLLIQTDKGPETIAWITRLHGEGENARYRCEILRRDGVRIAGKGGLPHVQLLLSDGVSETTVPVQGESEWGPLPWIFADRKGQWEFIGEGSIRCRDEKVHILLPKNGCLSTEDGEISSAGEAPELDRELYRAEGIVTWEHEDLGVCRIRCASPDAADVTYVLSGRKLQGTAEQTPPYKGVPELFTVNQNGIIKIVEDATAQWCPQGLGKRIWKRNFNDCAGEVWLRWANMDGEQLLCRKLRVVPSEAKIKITRVGADQQPGTLCITGFAGVELSVQQTEACHFNDGVEHNKIEIDCIAAGDALPTQFTAKFFWGDGRRLEIELPFPQEGAAFVYGNKTLSFGEGVPVAKLGAIQAIAQGPSAIQNFDLKVQIRSENPVLRNLNLRKSLSPDDSGRCTYQLHRIQGRIASLLALSGELDSLALLEIVGQGNRRMALLTVGQFDMTWEPRWDEGCIVIPDHCVHRLEADWEARLKARMVPLWNPAAEPIVLEEGESPSEFPIPEGLQPGPWWILGEDGDWARFRPLLWSVPGEAAETDSPLKRAILEEDPEVRENLMSGWVQQIALTPEHADWTLFFDYLELMRPYPASALDLFRYFVKFPEAIVMALLKSSDEDFDAVWSLTNELPFSWYLLPVNAWLSSARRHFGALFVALGEIESCADILWDHFQAFRERVTVYRPFFRQICDWLCPAIFPEKNLDNSELQIARNCPEMVMGLIQNEEQSLQSRHDADEKYPDGPETMKWTEHADYPEAYTFERMAAPFRPVRCAPFVAAHISLAGEPYDEKLLFELKRLRDFDRDWFTNVFAFALCLGLSQKSAN